MQANVLRGRIVTQFGSVSKFAAALGWPPTKVSRILREKQELTVGEAKQVAGVLKIADPSEVVAIFL